MNLDTLYDFTKNGKKKRWNISVERTEDGYGRLITTFGYVDGKQQVQERLVTKGKNLGKKNETDAFTQACNEAKSLWKKKFDQMNNNIEAPMLAHEYEKHKKHIVFPCFVQPKLDGVRMVAKMKNNDIMFYTRMGKPMYGMDHIRNEILKNELMKENDIWDGELFSKDMTFDEISGYCRNQKHSNLSIKPEFWVFDSYSKNNYIERKPLFEAYHTLKYIREVYCHEVNSEEEAKSYLDYFIQDGYEGIMFRNKEGSYEQNTRSYHLQKWKLFQDAEFQIIDIVEGKGLDQETGVFVCSTKDNNSFQVRCEGTKESRKEYLLNKTKYIGKYVTVKYQELTKNGIPRFPVGLRIREDFT